MHFCRVDTPHPPTPSLWRKDRGWGQARVCLTGVSLLRSLRLCGSIILLKKVTCSGVRIGPCHDPTVCYSHIDGLRYEDEMIDKVTFKQSPGHETRQQIMALLLPAD